MDQSPPTPVASPDLSLLQCSLQLALLPFQCLLGFLQFLDALPTEADLVCEVTDLLCRVNRAWREDSPSHLPCARLLPSPQFHSGPKVLWISGPTLQILVLPLERFQRLERLLVAMP